MVITFRKIQYFYLNMKVKTVLISTGIAVALFAIYNANQRKKAPKIYFRKKLASGYNARTIPPFGIYILETEKENRNLLNHELVHWKQYQQKGLINFYRQYGKEFNQFGYDKMPMEIEARTNENEYCKLNYTECVRNGKANTVHQPNFRL